MLEMISNEMETLKQSRIARLEKVQELAASTLLHATDAIEAVEKEEDNDIHEEIIKSMWEEAFQWLAAFEAKNGEN